MLPYPFRPGTSGLSGLLGQRALRDAGALRGRRGGVHEVEVHLLEEGAVQAVCTCGWRSEVFGRTKTVGTMDPLEQARDAGDLHVWDQQLSP